ncbi:MAG: chitosanase [Methylococcales bacterium]|nr:chitosanase [Methylococcales bacterium]
MELLKTLSICFCLSFSGLYSSISTAKGNGKGSTNTNVNLTTNSTDSGPASAPASEITPSNNQQEAEQINNAFSVLYKNQWRQISLPSKPTASANTVQALLGDDINGQYGTDWKVFSYNSSTDSYTNVGLNGVLKQGVGYWAIQVTDQEVTLDFPSNMNQGPILTSSQCASTNGCLEIDLPSKYNDVQWLMLGNPFAQQISWADLRVTTTSGACADGNGCTLDEAEGLGIINNQGWSYNPGVGKYDLIKNNDLIQEMNGFWVAVLENANGLTPKLLVPRKELTLDSAQKLVTDKFINLFERGDENNFGYGYTALLDDGGYRGLTVGRIFTTDNNRNDYVNYSDAYKVVKKYKEKGGTNDIIKIGFELAFDLSDIENRWKELANDARFKAAQDDIFNETVYQPALNQARKLKGSALTVLNLLSAYVLHGSGGGNGADGMISKTSQLTNNSSFNNRSDEKAWLKQFLKVRAEEFCVDAEHRKALAILSTLEDMVNKNEDIYFNLNGGNVVINYVIARRNYYEDNQSVAIAQWCG